MNSEIESFSRQFIKLYKKEPEVLVRAPGRIEVIGNHTDYNQGLTLSACISQNLLAFFRKRNDGLVRVFSNNFPTQRPIVFKMRNIEKDKKNSWTNFIRGVIKEILSTRRKITGADILIDSNIPIGAGLSSSAAIELATIFGFFALGHHRIDRLELARLARQAEDSFIGSPCGFLDQGTLALGQTNRMIFMDHRSKNNMPLKMSLIPADIKEFGVSLIVAVDKECKRELGSSGYPARRKICEDSLLFWQEVLGRKVGSLREVKKREFEIYKRKLRQFNPLMRKRVEHVIYENERVLEAAKRLERNDLVGFGRLMTLSGDSALRLYDLDEKTPELTFLFERGKQISGVLGIRNMGGGFSATVLTLVKNKNSKDFYERLGSIYHQKFKRSLEFIPVQITDGVSVSKL